VARLCAHAVFLAALLSYTLASSSAAFAQPAPASDREYRQLVREGLQEFSAGNFVEARTLLERAHALRPSARTLRGLGLVAYELRQYVRAVRELEAAIAARENPLTPEQVVEARSAIEKARRYIAIVVLSVQPAHAELRLDGQRVAPGEHRLDAGEHAVHAEAPDHRAHEKTFAVVGGQRLELPIALAELAPSAALPGPAPLESRAQGAAAADEGGSAWPWVVVGTGGALAAGGGVLLGLALSRKAELEDLGDGEMTWPEFSEERDAVGTRALIGGVLIGVGAAAAAGGLVWALSRGGRETLHVHAGPAGVQVRGTF
jgi:hypothetical protein